MTIDPFFLSSSLQPGRVVTLIEDDDVSMLLPVGFCSFQTAAWKLQSNSKCYFLSESYALFIYFLSLFFFSQESTWGVAFEVTGAQVEESLKYLNVRETVCGGYITKMVDFYPEGEGQSPVQALVYIATADNALYLGPASAEEIGAQIAVCRGKTGHNLEYLLRLAEFMRKSCPQVEDNHLFSIEAAALTMVSYLLTAQ